MPSPNFPSKIKTVKDSIEEKAANKNLLKFENKTDSGVTYDNSRINIKNATNYLYATSDIFNNKRISGKTYKVKYIVNGSISSSASKISFVWAKTGNNWYQGLEISTGTFDNKEYTREIALEEDEVITGFRVEKPTNNFVGDLTIDVMLYEDNDDTFVEHQEQTITMPVQQEMLKVDYFDFDREKEVHTMKKLVLQGTEAENRWTVVGNAETEWRFLISAEGILRTLSTTEIANIICNKLKTTSANNTFLKETGISGDDKHDAMIIYIEECKEMTVSEFNLYLKQQYDTGTPFIIYYKLATPIELDFTDEQKAVAKQIKESLHTYKNVTHIYSDDEVSPIVNVEYAKDLNTVINNIQLQDK